MTLGDGVMPSEMGLFVDTYELTPLDTKHLFALMGAEGEGDGGDDGGGDGGDDGGTGGDDGGSDDGLTEGGRKAIEAERAAAKRARDSYKPWASIKRDFGLTPEQVRERLSAKPEHSEQDAEAIKREALTEATKSANKRIARAEVKALAAAKFQDVEDALLFVDLDEIEVDDDGDVDTTAVSKVLDDVLKRKPHLAKTTKKTNGSDFDGGTRTPPQAKQGMSSFIRSATGRTAGR